MHIEVLAHEIAVKELPGSIASLVQVTLPAAKVDTLPLQLQTVPLLSTTIHVSVVEASSHESPFIGSPCFIVFHAH